MKFLRPFLLPALCFATAWVVTFFVSRRTESLPVGDPPVVRRSSVSRAIRDADSPRKITIAQLTEDFQTRPMAEWPKLWEGFATRATVADLTSIPRFVDKRDGSSVRRDGRNVLHQLATEELAVRADRPLAPLPGAYAALAEANPEAAWRNLARFNRSDLAIGVVRTLARRDPAGTLQRLQAMPRSMAAPRGFEADIGEGGMNSGSPLAAIFSAWVRQDPAAATAAMMKLPQSERTKITGEVAETWAYQDGPAAVRFILEFIPAGEDVSYYELRLESILRASLTSHPIETAELIAANAKLRAVMNDWQCRRIRKLWQIADPETALAWAMEEEAARKPGEEMDETARWNSRGRIFFEVIHSDSAAVERFIRALAAICSDSAAVYLRSSAHRHPDLAQSLATQLGITIPEDSDAKSFPIDDDPEAACDRWLEELQRHQDPAQALAALGWTQTMATALAERASRVFPNKATELAKLVPASSLDASPAGSGTTSNLTRYWPDLKVLPEKPQPVDSTASKPPFPESHFKLDPATAAEALLASPLSATDVTKAVQLWAPYDPAAASAWLARVPDAAIRQQGELKLAGFQASSDPLEVLAFLTTKKLPESSTRDLWVTCLHRLVATGGDWQGWLARMPGNPEQHWTPFGGRLPESLATEARLLELTRNPAGD